MVSCLKDLILQHKIFLNTIIYIFTKKFLNHSALFKRIKLLLTTEN
jgi:hypothetical protein